MIKTVIVKAKCSCRKESVKKEWKIRVLSATHESDMQKMDTLCTLCSTHLQLESRKQE